MQAWCSHPEVSGELDALITVAFLTDLRQETAASVTYLVNRLVQRRSQLPSRLRVLDLCTGTGCIPLLFHDELYSAIAKHPRLELLGIDLSKDAVRLARLNWQEQLKDQTNVRGEKSPRVQSLERTNFMRANVLARVASDENPTTPSVEGLLSDASASGEVRSEWDILTCNPPYISPRAFNHTTARSVRNFEPKLALVPAERPGLSDDEAGDMFYPRLLEIADFVRAKIVLFEVADLEQAQRVAEMVVSRNAFERVEIWRDDPSQVNDHHDHTGDLKCVRLRGEGNGRTVVAWRAEGLDWLGE